MSMTRRSLLVHFGATACCAISGTQVHADTLGRVICSLRGASGFIRVSNYREAAPEARRVIALITNGVGIRQNFEVKAADFRTSNLAFATIHSGRRRVVYDAAEFSFVNGRTHWEAVGVLGHEIGHHLAAHVYVSESSRHEEELEADYFSGNVIDPVRQCLPHIDALVRRVARCSMMFRLDQFEVFRRRRRQRHQISL